MRRFRAGLLAVPFLLVGFSAHATLSFNFTFNGIVPLAGAGGGATVELGTVSGTISDLLDNTNGQAGVITITSVSDPAFSAALTETFSRGYGAFSVQNGVLTGGENVYAADFVLWLMYGGQNALKTNSSNIWIGNDQGTSGITLTDASAPVPEPATLTLLGGGLVTLAAARRRRSPYGRTRLPGMRS